MSAQYLLSGLLGVDEEAVPLPVVVRSAARDKTLTVTCPMTFYETKHRHTAEMVRRVVQKVQTTTAFLQDEGTQRVDHSSGRDSPLAHVKQVMTAHFPELTKVSNGFDWPLAFDYFTCRRAHNIAIRPEVRERVKGHICPFRPLTSSPSF